MQQYRQSQDVNKTENQCRKSQDMGRRCSTGTKKYPSEVEMGLDHHHKGSSLQLSATTEKVNQKPT